MINLELLLQTLDFRKCDQPTDQLTDRTESRDAIASKKAINYILSFFPGSKAGASNDVK